jgi:hypothetical protein
MPRTAAADDAPFHDRSGVLGDNCRLHLTLPWAPEGNLPHDTELEAVKKRYARRRDGSLGSLSRC